MTRCFSLLAVMTVSVAEEKHLMTEERMEILMEFQVVLGTGSFLWVQQLLWMNVRAVTTLERLWLRSRRLVMRSEDGSEGTVAIRLMVLEGRS